MLVLVLAEAALELVPPELAGHPAVAADARRRGKRPQEVLLDRARHHPAMGALRDAERRGRPDLVHQVLLAFLYSPLALSGRGRIYVHTRDDLVVSVEPGTRIPKNYNNFVGLMEQLFKLGQVPPDGRPLLRLERRGLKELLEELGGRWVALHEGGRRATLEELGRALADGVAVLGGFPHGDFQNGWVLEEAADVVRIGDRPLEAGQVACRLLAAVEAHLGLI